MGWASHLAACDRSVMQVLGGPVQYTPTIGVAVAVTGIFDETHVSVDAGRAGVSGSGPAVFLMLADLPSDPETDETAVITVGGANYTVREVQKDGTGGVLLLLLRT